MRKSLTFCIIVIDLVVLIQNTYGKEHWEKTILIVKRKEEVARFLERFIQARLAPSIFAKEKNMETPSLFQQKY